MYKIYQVGKKVFLVVVFNMKCTVNTAFVKKVSAIIYLFHLLKLNVIDPKSGRSIWVENKKGRCLLLWFVGLSAVEHASEEEDTGSCSVPVSAFSVLVLAISVGQKKKRKLSCVGWRQYNIYTELKIILKVT